MWMREYYKRKRKEIEKLKEEVKELREELKKNREELKIKIEADLNFIFNEMLFLRALMEGWTEEQVGRWFFQFHKVKDPSNRVESINRAYQVLQVLIQPIINRQDIPEDRKQSFLECKRYLARISKTMKSVITR